MTELEISFDDEPFSRPPGVQTAPELVAGKQGEHLARFRARVDALAHRNPGDLLPWLETQTDPAMLWPIHLVLHRHGIAPIMRGPRHRLSEQGRFIDFAADVAWLQARWPHHRPKYRRLQTVFKELPESSLWWNLLRDQFSLPGSQNARSWTIALGLHEDQRQDLRTIQTAPRRRLFEELHGERFGALCDALASSIAASPDKSGKVKPGEAANRRARIWRTHKLGGGSYSDTVALWQKLSGEARSKQALRHQVEMAEPIARQLRAEWAAENNRHIPDVSPAVIPKV